MFVFPGEGAQYPNMLADLCLQFAEARAVFDRIDRLYADHPRGHLLSDWVFPRPAFSEAERQRTEARLMELDIAVEAVLTANAAVYAVMRRLVPRCDAILGHSTGEHSAAMAAGALDLDTDERLAAFCHGLLRLLRRCRRAPRGAGRGAAGDRRRRRERPADRRRRRAASCTWRWTTAPTRRCSSARRRPPRVPGRSRPARG